jgi:hypothetical protein
MFLQIIPFSNHSRVSSHAEVLLLELINESQFVLHRNRFGFDFMTKIPFCSINENANTLQKETGIKTRGLAIYLSDK